MPLTLQQLRDDVRDHVGVDESEYPDAKCDLDLNKSWWDVADSFDFKEKETVRTYNTVDGTNTYSIETDGVNGIQQVVITDPNSSQHTPLTHMSLIMYESDFVDTDAAKSKPTHYITRGYNVILWPTPDAVYEITEYYWKTLADIAAGGVEIPQSWHEIIMYGAVSRAFARFGDYNRNRAARGVQVELMSTKETTNTREKADMQNAGLVSYRPRYP